MNNAELEMLDSLGGIESTYLNLQELAQELKDIPDEALQNAFVLSQGLIETFYKAPNTPNELVKSQVRTSSLIAYEIARRTTA